MRLKFLDHDRSSSEKGGIAAVQLIIEIPDALARRLASLASEQNKSAEQVCVEQLAALLLEPAEENLGAKYERFFQQGGLFVERSAEEKQRYHPVSEDHLKELAAKLGAAGPLSEVIVAERGRN
jgi:hypothetical protein